MGREISTSEYLDETEFQTRLRDETKLVMGWFRDHAFENPHPTKIGLELEAWLVDKDGFPSPRNEEFLKRVDNPLVVPELAAFNFEINGEPEALSGRVFSQIEKQLRTIWDEACVSANTLGLDALMIGIPATLRQDMLTLDSMTPSNRYQLLNDRLFQMRNGQPLHIDIDGRDSLEMVQDHLMLEAACTSLQVHLMLNQENSARSYNAAQIASAPLVAISANAPFLYGRRLWEETRIPAFEEAINLPGYRDRSGRKAGRVTFGTQYLRQSMMELFLENLDGYTPFLPMCSDDAPDKLTHLRLQNGTIWRWNRPIIQPAENGQPHLRLENRVIPAGPTLVDMVANMAFFIGLTLYLRDIDDLEERLLFESARKNFYSCAKKGLSAEIDWLDGKTGNVQTLISTQMAEQAQEALVAHGVDALEAGHYMNIIKSRARNGQTGSAWQRAHANCHGRDFQKLVQDYLVLQNEGLPVHGWRV